MTVLRDGEPVLTPTTRVGGGASARLMALLVAGILVAVVGFAVINRPPAPEPPIALVPSPAPTASPPRTQLEGNDGIFGWPVVAQLPAYQVRRGPGRYNRCRWDVGPTAARPQLHGDEASCP